MLVLAGVLALALVAVAVRDGDPPPNALVEPTPRAGAEHIAVVVGGDERTAGLRARIEREMPGAVDAVTHFWGSDWAREIVVVLTVSDAEFATQTGEPGRDWSGIAAVAVADHVDPVARSAAGQRIVFSPGAVGISDEALRIVLRHELFHYAARPDTAADAPVWLTEGVADFVARPAPSVGEPVPPAVLPTDAEFNGGGEARSAAYDRAWWFARFVADQFGSEALRRLYVDACGPGHTDVGAAVAAALGVDMPRLLARWQRWRAAQ